MAPIIILVTFIITPFAADYFESPRVCWGIASFLICYQTWISAIKKSPKDIAFEKARVEEARKKVEQIKEDAARTFLQGGRKGDAKIIASKDVNNMSEDELAIAARKIVQDLRKKKGDENPPETMKKAA